MQVDEVINGRTVKKRASLLNARDNISKLRQVKIYVRPQMHTDEHGQIHCLCTSVFVRGYNLKRTRCSASARSPDDGCRLV